MGVDDSELSNNAIGVSSKKEKNIAAQKKNKKNKDKKNKKRKSRQSKKADDSDDETTNKEPSTLKINT